MCQHTFFTTTTTATTTTTTIDPPANTVHHCDRSYCNGYGDCEIIDGQRRCLCYQDFHGDTCQYRSSNHASTDCNSEDCSHEGTCYMQDGRPHCQCYTHRYGDYCEYFDYCEAVSPCLNGGTCVNQMDVNHSYTCTCPYGREGSHCENESLTTTTTTTTQRSSTTAPTSSVTSTTAPTTTPPYPYSHCNKYSTVGDLAHNDSVEQPTAFQCSSGSHTGSDAFVLQNCNVNASNQWMQGRQVVTDCSDIPAFTPIATFEVGTFSSKNVAGVFIDCLSNGFRIATQSCDQSPTIVHIANGGSGNLNPNAYYTVQ
ncbi:delta-like protein 4 [Mya arenaria]|uniref:delta-like protein 4 n=1 Tax=Mya arenaria TaxID=6604 RepID=UPI0022E7BDA0|nr:delta-like protein 4 [Mya arenaria]